VTPTGAPGRAHDRGAGGECGEGGESRRIDFDDSGSTSEGGGGALTSSDGRASSKKDTKRPKAAPLATVAGVNGSTT